MYQQKAEELWNSMNIGYPAGVSTEQFKQEFFGVWEKYRKLEKNALVKKQFRPFFVVCDDNYPFSGSIRIDIDPKKGLVTEKQRSGLAPRRAATTDAELWHFFSAGILPPMESLNEQLASGIKIKPLMDSLRKLLKKQKKIFGGAKNSIGCLHFSSHNILDREDRVYCQEQIKKLNDYWDELCDAERLYMRIDETIKDILALLEKTKLLE